MIITMMSDPAWSSIISELFIDLAAGWFGAVFIVPNFSEKRGLEKIIVLTLNIILGIVCLEFAFLARKLL